MRLALRAAGPRSAEDAWERYAQPSLWSTWSPQIRSVESSADRLAVGVTGTVHPWLAPGVPFEVTAYDEAERSWAWTVRLPLVSLRLEHRVAAAPHGSRTELTVHGPAVVVLAYAPLAQVALHRLVSG